jgi:hypothetical protein
MFIGCFAAIPTSGKSNAKCWSNVLTAHDCAALCRIVPDCAGLCRIVPDLVISVIISVINVPGVEILRVFALNAYLGIHRETVIFEIT